jgi:hypothetical protein
VTEERKPKPFALDPPQTSFTLRDLDNAQPVTPRPQGLNLNHPRLAPPGMAGIKPKTRWQTVQAANVNVRVSVEVSDASNRKPKPAPTEKPKLALGQEGEAKRAFAPIVRTPSGKDRSWER